MRKALRLSLRLSLLAIVALVGTWLFSNDNRLKLPLTEILNYARERTEGVRSETAVDCAGIMKGQPQSLAKAKEIQRKLPAPLSASLLAEAFRSKNASCDACSDKGGGREKGGGGEGGGKEGGGEDGE